MKQVFTSASFHKPGEAPVVVSLPHTWNAFDGADGGADFFRDVCTYEWALPDPVVAPETRYFLQFDGANHIAEVFVNETFVGRHEGGFSTFRFDITEYLKVEGNQVRVTVDNRKSHVYPQRADFTFFGGLYREVSLLTVPKAHFDLLYHGTSGIFVTPSVDGSVHVVAHTVDADSLQIACEVMDASGAVVATSVVPAAPQAEWEMNVKNPHLWDGTKDAYLYHLSVKLLQNGAAIDSRDVEFGFRSFSVHPKNGFILNGRQYPLHGVCRHQDRKDMGWAITEKEHREDMDYILEVGANSMRLAHYQHAQLFYDLCDQNGLVVWAEIPFISGFMFGEEARANTLSQMEELILQNYNHPSICFWGIGNELTIGKNSPELEENLRAVNALAKKLDSTRLTTIAHLAGVEPNHPHTLITDVHAGNYYFGWYRGTMEETGPFLDRFAAEQPDKPFGVSEYGVDNDIRWHSASPINHDYTEEYSTKYHYHMLRVFEERPYLWGTFLWNMFDFAADMRDEGGVKGINCKGLMTYDRKVKKEAFYLYQAFWSEKPMVHIASQRFLNRAPGERTIEVFTNEPEVLLTVNGKEIGTAVAEHHLARFEEVELMNGKNTIVATTKGATDTCVFNGVAEHDTSYDLPEILESQKAGNWFASNTDESEELPEGECYDVDDPLGVLFEKEECYETVRGWIMAKDAPLDLRLLCAGRLRTFEKNNPASTLREKKNSIGAIMTAEDFDVVNKRLHRIPKK